MVSEKTRVRAILSGDNGPAPKLAFPPPNARFTLGDRIVTSGHGGVFPAGLPIGRISSVEDGVIRVKPFADFDQLEYVRIITEFPGEVAGQLFLRQAIADEMINTAMQRLDRSVRLMGPFVVSIILVMLSALPVYVPDTDDSGGSGTSDSLLLGDLPA